MFKLLRSSYRKFPLISNSISGFVIFGSGDILSQCVASKDSHKSFRQVDFRRAFDTSLLGVFMNGLCLHGWYRILEHTIGTSMLNNKVVVLKCVADQFCYAPFSILVFFSFTGIRTGGTSAEIKENIQSKVNTSFISTWIADCTLWPLVNAANFSLIPLNYRPTFVGVAQLFWMTYLAFVGNKPHVDSHKIH